jgi:hypothetical protein
MARRRVAVKGMGRRVVAGKAAATVTPLDDRPLSVTISRDGKRLIIALPYEVWVMLRATHEVERRIELPSPAPSVFEAEEGVLWIGGTHLHRASLFSATAAKTGTKLGGFVDHVARPRPHLLCGVGTQGEILYDLDKGAVVHRRKVSEHEVHGVVASADGRALFVDGTPHAWVIDPDHASGYMKLGLKSTSPVDVPDEGLVAVGMTASGRALIAARDGAVGWTNRALRIEDERMVRTEAPFRLPLAIAGNERWIYVLRPAGILHRILVAQPDPEPDAKEEPEPLPEAQSCRLPRRASCMAVDAEGQLVVAGPSHDDQLGQLWTEDPQSLTWEPLRTFTRKRHEQEAGGDAGPKSPSFVATRTKVTGEALSTIKVDDVLAGKTRWLTRDTGTLRDRPCAPLPAGANLLAADTIVLPAMLRLHEGTARPGLLVWPGVADEHRPIPALHWLTWGDDPREWIELVTPALRGQGWDRRQVFPLQIALPAPPPDAPGRRAELSPRWVDPELFAALRRECKKLLRVLW